MTTRIRKISVGLDELNAFLVSKGLKPLPPNYNGPGLETLNIDPSAGDPNVFGSDIPALTYTEPKKKAPLQPIWKWSWDPVGGLLIWPVDKIYGQPHHIEVTGADFYKLAQGRVYETETGGYEILVWEDRASLEWQEAAVEDVNAWLLKNTGEEAEDSFWQGEGGYYPTIGEGTPDQDKMIEAYFGVGMQGLDPRKRDKLRRQYKSLFSKPVDVAPDPYQQQQDNDAAWLSELSDQKSLNDAWKDAADADDICPACKGEGTDVNGLKCLYCKGTGTKSIAGATY